MVSSEKIFYKSKEIRNLLHYFLIILCCYCSLSDGACTPPDTRKSPYSLHQTSISFADIVLKNACMQSSKEVYFPCSLCDPCAALAAYFICMGLHIETGRTYLSARISSGIFLSCPVICYFEMGISTFLFSYEVETISAATSSTSITRS